MQWTFSETQSLMVEVEFWYFFNKQNVTKFILIGE